jgi:hypothetical protein
MYYIRCGVFFVSPDSERHRNTKSGFDIRRGVPKFLLCTTLALCGGPN